MAFQEVKRAELVNNESNNLRARASLSYCNHAIDIEATSPPPILTLGQDVRGLNR